MTERTELLIVGAGPFGLSLAAYAKHHDLDHVLLGEPMQFWRANMPSGMLLRSACDWHLDPLGVDTIERFLESRGLVAGDVEPLSLDFYLQYAEWFQAQKGLEARGGLVRRLDRRNGREAGFEASLDNGRTLAADRVVLALGFRNFKHVPDELSDLLPPGRFGHTCDLVDFAALQGKRCLIVGGRQSALEWAALLHEAGASAVHVTHRHPTPAFEEADWSWVNPLVDAMVDDPAWFRNLSRAEQEALNERLWAEGRLKVEPWLAPRLAHDSITLWPSTRIVASQVRPAGDLEVRLDNGETLTVDHVVLATGYQVDMSRVPFLAAGDVLDEMEVVDGFPVLDSRFQTSVPGLFVTSMPATRDFGPFFAFTVSVRTSARVIGGALTAPSS